MSDDTLSDAPSTPPAAGTRPGRLQRCPHCHFAIRPRAHYLTLDYCPRCVAKRGVAEAMSTTGNLGDSR